MIDFKFLLPMELKVPGKKPIFTSLKKCLFSKTHDFANPLDL